jgi:hypothetical protein
VGKVYIIYLILYILGDWLDKLKPVVVYVDREISDWLDSKALEGYKKAGLVRYILKEYVKGEVRGNGAA